MNIKIKIKIVIYVIIAIAVQHIYNTLTNHSGGGIAVVVFTMFDLLDDDFTLFGVSTDKKDN